MSFFSWDTDQLGPAVILTFISLIIGAILSPIINSIITSFGNYINKIAESLLSNFSDKYKKYMIDQVKYINLHGISANLAISVELEEVFVEPKFKIFLQDTETSNIERIYSISDVINGSNWTVVLGGPGTGKSTLVNYLALMVSTNKAKLKLGVDKDLFPIYIVLRDVSRNIQSPDLPSFVNWLVNFLKSSGLNPSHSFFYSKLQKGECLIILDGLDEVGSSENRYKVTKWINDAVSLYPDNKFIITSRPFGYESIPLLGGFKSFILIDFNTQQIVDFIHKWYLSIDNSLTNGDEFRAVSDRQISSLRNAEALITSIFNNSNIEIMAANPLLLSIITLVHRYKGKLSKRRVDLYAECVDVLLGYWDKAKGISIDLSLVEKREILQSLALWFHGNQKRGMRRREVENHISGFLKGLGQNELDTRSVLEAVSRRSGLLLEQEVDYFTFSHFTFQEYLAARQILESDEISLLTNVTTTQPSLSESILLVAVTKIEVQAIREVFSGAIGKDWTRRYIGNKTYYDLGIHGNVPVWLVQSEMGTGTPGGALLTVHQAIQDLHPQAVIMCGIAFGLRPDKQRLGDVLIAHKLRSYEPQKIDEQKGQIQRGDCTTASERLLDRLRSADNDWKGAKTYFGLILSGEKLVNDPAFRDQLLKIEPEAVGGEMEGAGLYVAARDAKVDWILVKGICDWADGNKNSDAQVLAACNAAKFLLHVLQLGGWSGTELSKLSEPNINSDFIFEQSLTKNIREPWWEQVLIFYCSMGDSKSILEELLKDVSSVNSLILIGRVSAEARTILPELRRQVSGVLENAIKNAVEPQEMLAFIKYRSEVDGFEQLEYIFRIIEAEFSQTKRSAVVLGLYLKQLGPVRLADAIEKVLLFGSNESNREAVFLAFSQIECGRILGLNPNTVKKVGAYFSDQVTYLLRIMKDTAINIDTRLAAARVINLAMREVQEGEFTMGCSDEYARKDESPAHSIFISSFLVDIVPVTNIQYYVFLQETKRLSPPSWTKDLAIGSGAITPVVNVTFYDCIAYAKWIGKELPSEAEWEKAARGFEERRWPWGNIELENVCNYSENSNRTISVASHLENISPFGILDMVGNVWEYTRSLYKPYPYDSFDGREDIKIEGYRVLRGGSFKSINMNELRTTRRNWDIPTHNNDWGFRCILHLAKSVDNSLY